MLLSGKETHTHMNNNQSPKNGYEIRLEILKMAKDRADTAWYHKNEASEKMATYQNHQAAWQPSPDNRVEEALAVAEPTSSSRRRSNISGAQDCNWAPFFLTFYTLYSTLSPMYEILDTCDLEKRLRRT